MKAKSVMVDDAPGVVYEVTAANLQAHLWGVAVHIAKAPTACITVSLPVWLAGSYMVREFSKHLQNLSASQGNTPLLVEQLSKNTWQIACTPGKRLSLIYEVYAYDPSVRSAWLGAERGFFNPTSVCLRVHGLDLGVQHIRIKPTPATQRWRVFTGLDAVAPPQTAKPQTPLQQRGFTTYEAANYEQLADSPFELGLMQADGGPLWCGEFVACGTPHRFVVANAWPSFDGGRLLADTKRICETAIEFWHPLPSGKPKKRAARAPMRHYTFMLNASAHGYGGLEHHNSTALIAARADLPRVGTGLVNAAVAALPNAEGYTRLLGLISHEYFHTWNVKRLRPAEFVPYNFESEQYTELLWFFEGFTSYFDDLLLLRAGLIGEQTYLTLLEKTVQTVHNMPGRFVQSVAQASFDAWVKYYRTDENTANATISYYTKGSLVALAFDLSLRLDGSSLDAAMRALWSRCKGGAMREGDFAQVLQELSGRSYAEELAQWVHGTADLPLGELLAEFGLRLQGQRQEGTASVAASLGLLVADGATLQIKTVLHGGVAQMAGFAPGDEWWAVGVEVDASPAAAVWRLFSLGALRQLAGPGQRTSAWVARDGKVLQLPLTMPTQAEDAKTLRLGVVDAERAKAWLGSTGLI